MIKKVHNKLQQDGVFMGLFGLFNKEATCEKCGETMSKKLIGLMDSTHQGKRKDGKRLKLCNKCMLDTFYTYLRDFKDRAIIVYPDKQNNAYAFYQFQELSEYPEEYFELIDNMKGLQPPTEEKCNRCSNSAQYTWCSKEVFMNSDPYTMEVNTENNYESQYLCRDCLVNAFNQRVADENISFYTIFPPISGEGFCTPWDV